MHTLRHGYDLHVPAWKLYQVSTEHELQNSCLSVGRSVDAEHGMQSGQFSIFLC